MSEAPREARWSDFMAPRWWSTWFGLLLLRVLGFLPVPVLAGIGAVLGELLYLTAPQRRHITLTNLRACFPEVSPPAQRRLARAHFRAMAQAMMTVPLIWWGSARRLNRLMHLRGDEHLRAALADRKPVLLLSAHFVGIEVGGVALSQHYPVLDMYKKPKNALIHFFLRRCRRRFGGYLVERSEGIKPVIRAIRQGVLFLYLTDQDQGMEGAVFAPFFGIQTATISGLSRLAATLDARVVPCFMRILPGGRGFAVEFQPRLDNFPTADVVADTTRMNQLIEKVIRTMPAQYLWSHRRFKTRPPGEPPFY